MLTGIRRIIVSKIKGLGLEKAFLFGRLQTSWDGILKECLDEQFCGKSRPLRISGASLTVDCLNSVWASEMRFKEEDLLKAIQDNIKQMKIEKINFIS